MVRPIIAGLILFGLLLLSPHPSHAADSLQFYDLAAGRTISADDFASRMAAHRFILVGERHTVAAHHRAQLAVIMLLADNGVPVAVGLEMMRADSQPNLDAWVAGRLDEDEIAAVYRDNWNFPWALYRPIFMSARDHQIPLVGLNVSRNITRQVARQGFDSLSPSQRRGLPFVTCQIDDDYMAYIREAYGAHGHGNMTFDNFCEAQLVWDKAMAANALQYSREAPERVVVILSGTGHARKGGIPRQLTAGGGPSPLVVLPEIPSILTPDTLTTRDADVLIQGF